MYELLFFFFLHLTLGFIENSFCCIRVTRTWCYCFLYSQPALQPGTPGVHLIFPMSHLLEITILFSGLFLDFSLVFHLSACIPLSIPYYLITVAWESCLISERLVLARTHFFKNLSTVLPGDLVSFHSSFTLYTDIFRWRLSVLNKPTFLESLNLLW